MALESNLKGIILSVCSVALLPLLLLVTLLLTKVLSVAWFVSWIIIILVVGALIVVFSWKFLIKKDDVTKMKSCKSLDAVREYVLEAIVKKHYFDEVSSVSEESVREIGLDGHKERLYFLTYRSVFERLIFSVIVNMSDFDKQSKMEYDPQVVDDDFINDDVHRRSQSLVVVPEKMVKYRERKTSNPVLGTETIEKEPLGEDKRKDDADEEVK